MPHRGVMKPQMTNDQRPYMTVQVEPDDMVQYVHALIAAPKLAELQWGGEYITRAGGAAALERLESCLQRSTRERVDDAANAGAVPGSRRTHRRGGGRAAHDERGRGGLRYSDASRRDVAAV